MTIENIAEAKEAVAAVGDFLERFHQTLGKLGSLAGNSRGDVASSPRPRLKHAIEPAIMQKAPALPVPAPESMPERVIAILKDAAEPMTPRQMVERYNALGWPAPKNGKLYSALLSSAYYLRAKKGLLKAEAGKYSIVMTNAETKA